MVGSDIPHPLVWQYSFKEYSANLLFLTFEKWVTLDHPIVCVAWEQIVESSRGKKWDAKITFQETRKVEKRVADRILHQS